jgi:hypothetical protein
VTVVRTRLGIALLAAALALAFQALTVRYNYGGDWTALFSTGDRWAQPPELSKPYQFRDSWGYDGQFYRLIAHDPLMRRGFAKYLDDPRYRYSRIFVPALAYAAALGDDRFIDYAYIALILTFVFAGAYWLSMFAGQRGWPLWTGVLFLLVPATLVGLDRLTIDLVLAAFCVAFVVLRSGSIGWFAVLVCAALTRETGFLLIAAACVRSLIDRRFRAALFTGLTAAPAVAWFAWVSVRIPSSTVARTSFIPLAGFVARLAHPMQYSLTPGLNGITQLLDYGALLGVAIAMWGLWRLKARWREAPELLASAIPVLFVSLPDVWSEVFAFGRTMTPFWLFVALRGSEARIWIALLPILLMDLRIVWQLGPELLGIVRGLVT